MVTLNSLATRLEPETSRTPGADYVMRMVRRFTGDYDDKSEAQKKERETKEEYQILYL
ncbi:hypothetical protein SAMN05428988_4110 [Chitinophaga sp. YR573]|nr:hypothetical protein SAMN05428988_4110 [Chitinophaga sp. YR573]